MFKSARIKLTACYLLIIMVVTVSFSAIVYTNVTKQIQRGLEMQERRIRNRIPPIPRFPNEPFLDKQTILEIKKDTLLTLITINLIILIGIGLPGYWLAGKTLKPIEDMIEKQKKFVADAAHELKTPLTAIKTDIEVNLRNKNMDIKKARSVLENTIKEVDSLTMLTNSLIKQSKYQDYTNSGKEIIDLKTLIEEINDKLTPKAKAKNIETNISGENIKIEANKESISELITIILDNAIKFNKDNGLVEVFVEKRDNKAFIKVKDTGEGIDSKDIPHIFDRFYKSDTSRSKSQNEGFGLGLSIAKEIAESHDGHVSVTSKKGEGSEFIISLPVSQ